MAIMYSVYDDLCLSLALGKYTELKWMTQTEGIFPKVAIVLYTLSGSG